MYILIAVMIVNATYVARPVSFTQEFMSQEACVTAKEDIRIKAADTKFSLLVCEKK